MCGHQITVSLIIESKMRFEIGVRDPVTLDGITFDWFAGRLKCGECTASLRPVFALTGCFPDSYVVDRCARQIELKGKVRASPVNDGVSADNEFFVVQMRNHFVVSIFHRHRLPLVRARPADAFAKVSGHNPCLSIDGRVELKVLAMNLRDAVVATSATGHEPKVCGLP